jgi:putative ABC transport system substrate-binding protein
VRRRTALAALTATTALWRDLARAEGSSPRKLGLLMGGRGEADPEGQARLEAVRTALAERGWVEGSNLRIDLRWAAGDAGRLQASAAEIVALAPDVILANSTPAIGALVRLTKTIPIVFAQIVDPVGLGYVKSLAKPGGNLTGFTFVDLELIRKWPEILREIAPGVTRAALLFNPATTPFYAEFVRTLALSAEPGATRFVPAPVPQLDDLEGVIADLGRTSGTGLIIPPNPLIGANRRRVAELAMQHRLPSIAVYREFVTEGGLMSYGPNSIDIFRRSTGYVDRILRGADPGDLPVQAPTSYELLVNARTARALGLTIPQSILARADEVIE